MSMKIKQLEILNSSESAQLATSIDTNSNAIDFEKEFQNVIKKTIKNYRYAYNNDGLIQGLIHNTVTTANNKFLITYDDSTIPRIEEAKEWIKKKVKEWNLDDLITEFLIKSMVDGKVFYQKIIDKGSITKLNTIGYDGEDYDIIIIRNPSNGEILGYKQKYLVPKDYRNWKNLKFNNLTEDRIKYDEANFTPEEVIYGTLINRDGEGMSLLDPILDNIYKKWVYEGYKLSISHKTGNLAVVTVGSKEVKTDNVSTSFINQVLANLKNRVKKDVITVPYGTSIDTVGGNYQVPDLDKYMNRLISEIYIQLQSPETLFSSANSNRSTIEVQTDDKIGFGVFLEFLRDRVKNTFEKELIDTELELQGFSDCVGHINITFIPITISKQLTMNLDDPDLQLIRENTSYDENGNAIIDNTTTTYNKNVNPVKEEDIEDTDDSENIDVDEEVETDDDEEKTKKQVTNVQSKKE